VSALTGLPIAAVHKAIETGLIHPGRKREGKTVTRLFSKTQILFLFLEARGLRLLPLPTRRGVAKQLERNPNVNSLQVTEGSVVRIECKSARQAAQAGFRRLAQAQLMVDSQPDVMHGTPVYKGTRIPVQLIADMLAQGTEVEEILQGYPALTRQGIQLAPLYVKAFPRRGRPAARPWARKRTSRTFYSIKTN